VLSQDQINFDEFLEEFTRMQNFVMMKAVQSLFKDNDLNHDGKLDKSEYLNVLTTLLGADAALKQLDVLFDEADVDQ
jgi:Ca2+-binding EF-hand superfamily protein